ncbi:Hypothetical predicted protein [Cloeon dipterum]|uniref:Uncharacterized protein n=1 Tax=Cloeon dipterum TaxID=197152 RepID=A0A8S1CJQ9_9INSE|nr:Hypothetical predicted protein [Cloeon dipterum]
MENKFLYHKFFDAYLNYHSQNATKENQLVAHLQQISRIAAWFAPSVRFVPLCLRRRAGNLFSLVPSARRTPFGAAASTERAERVLFGHAVNCSSRFTRYV